MLPSKSPTSKSEDTRLIGPNDLGRIVGNNFVFRDFEFSQIDRLRRAFRHNTVELSIYALLMVGFWQICITMGGSLYYTNNLALGLFPSGAHIVIAAGGLIFPLRLWYVLFAAYVAVFFIPLGFDIWSLPAPIEGGLSKSEIVTTLFALNLGVCVLTIIATRALFFELKKFRSPITVDLIVAVSTQIVFTALFLIAAVYLKYSDAEFTVSMRSAIGFDDELWSLAFRRITVGGVTVTAFLIAMIQHPKLRYFPNIILISSVFVLYLALYKANLVVLPELELAIIVAFISQTASIRHAPLAILIGVSTFTAFTGYAIGLKPPSTKIDQTILIYSTLIIALAGLSLTFRSYFNHLSYQRVSSLRRLNVVRNFANVGLFSVNIDTRQIRFDEVTQKIFDAPAKMDLGTLLQRFPKDEQLAMRKILTYKENETGDILARFTHIDQDLLYYVRLFIWQEQNSAEQPMIYGLAIDVTAEHNNEKALSDTLDELEYRSEKMSQMFSIISHEIRSPAAVISMLIEDLETKNEVDETKQNLKDATDHLLDVLNDMRQAVNPEKNLPVNLRPFIAEEITTSVRNTFAFQARDAGFDVRLNFGPGAQETRIGDSTRIKQILGNVVRNAIVHSGGSRIKINYTTETAGAGEVEQSVWTITDNGVGISESQIVRLFEPFQRGNDDPRNRVDGSGLGLYIVKISVEVLGGSIKFFRPIEGGAGYRITIPAPLYVEDSSVCAPEITDARFDTKRLKVLLVEDNRLVSQVVESRLRKLVAEIRVAANGQEAIEMLNNFEPDLIISDLFMPLMAGDELCAFLRSEGFSKPIIGLTAATVGDEMSDFLEAGATTVLSKPLEVEQLTSFLWGYYTDNPQEADAVFGPHPSEKTADTPQP